MDVLLLNLVFIERKRVRRGNELPRPDFQLFAPLIPVHAPDVYSEYIDNLKFSLGKWMEPALVWEKSTIYTFILTEKLASKVFFKVFLTDSLLQLIWPFFWELYVSAQQGARRACQPPSWPRYGCASCRRSSRPCPSIGTWLLEIFFTFLSFFTNLAVRQSNFWQIKTTGRDKTWPPSTVF